MTAPLHPVEQNALEMIRRAIDAGEPCPKNIDFCVALTLGSVSTAADILTRLEKKGAIRVERFAVSRIVTDLTSGRSTAGKRKPRLHWRYSGAKSPGAYVGVKAARAAKGAIHDDPPVPIGPRIDRTPCPRCGARGTVDCGHSRAPLSMGAFPAAAAE